MGSSGLSALLWFVAIVAMIPVALWLLKRNRADGNRAFERAARGDVLIVEAATTAPERVELERATTVERRRPGGG